MSHLRQFAVVLIFFLTHIMLNALGNLGLLQARRLNLKHKATDTMNTSLNIVSPASRRRLGRWHRLLLVIAASFAALTLQTKLLAQDDLNLIGLYQNTGQTMTGKAA